MPSAPHRPAFALLELAAAILIGAALLALLVIMGGESRRQARLGEDMAKLRRIGALTSDYAADCNDQFWSFSWKKGQALSAWPELNNASSNLQAGANQAVDILRRVAGREDIFVISGWIAQVLYNHLPLGDHIGRVPEQTFVSSLDRHRLKWSADPKGFDAGFYQPAPTGAPGTNAGKRWPYGASFQMPTSFYDSGSPGVRVTQSSTQSTYNVPAEPVLAGRTTAAVGFPALKVLLHDQHGRHFGKRVAFCVHPQARLPLLMADGSLAVRTASDANPGWQPNAPTVSAPTVFQYQPDVWEPPTFTGQPAEIIDAGRFRWTRGITAEHGIAGRDFGAAETCSGQPGCP